MILLVNRNNVKDLLGICLRVSILPVSALYVPLPRCTMDKLVLVPFRSLPLVGLPMEVLDDEWPRRMRMPSVYGK